MTYQDLPADLKKHLANSADELLNAISCELGDSPDWQSVARLLALELVTLKHRHDAITDVGNQFLKKYRIKRQQEKQRVANRTDQQHKRQFQSTIVEYSDDYPTIQSAIDDLKVKPEFSPYNEQTLRIWARGVWPKQTKQGRPKKQSREKL